MTIANAYRGGASMEDAINTTAAETSDKRDKTTEPTGRNRKGLQNRGRWRKDGLGRAAGDDHKGRPKRNELPRGIQECPRIRAYQGS